MSAKSRMICLTAFALIVVLFLLSYREIIFYLFTLGINQKLSINDEANYKICEFTKEYIMSNPGAFKPILIKKLCGKDQEASYTACCFLGMMYINDNPEFIRIVNESPFLHTRKNAAELIIADKTSCVFLIRTFREVHKDPDVRSICMRKLIDSEDPDVIKANCELLNDPDPEIRKIATAFFGLDYQLKCYQKIKTLINDKDPRIRMRVIFALRKQVGQYYPEYSQALSDSDLQIVTEALAAIKVCGDKQAIPALDKLVKTTKDPYLKKEAKRVLEGLRK
jgi:hypothetical protein